MSNNPKATVETLRGFSKESIDSIENYYRNLDEVDALIEEGEALLDIRSPEFLRQT